MVHDVSRMFRARGTLPQVKGAVTCEEIFAGTEIPQRLVCGSCVDWIVDPCAAREHRLDP